MLSNERIYYEEHKCSKQEEDNQYGMMLEHMERQHTGTWKRLTSHTASTETVHRAKRERNNKSLEMLGINMHTSCAALNFPTW